MGVGHIGDIAAGDQTLGVSPEWQSRLTTEQANNAVGVYAAVSTRLFDYDRLSDLDIQGFNSDPACRFSDAVALDLITWTAVAILRLDAADNLLTLPEPDLLVEPGWYTEPIFAKMERYWDGTDWTDKCRMLEGRRYMEGPFPMR